MRFKFKVKHIMAAYDEVEKEIQQFMDTTHIFNIHAIDINGEGRFREITIVYAQATDDD